MLKKITTLNDIRKAKGLPTLKKKRNLARKLLGKFKGLLPKGSEIKSLRYRLD